MGWRGFHGCVATHCALGPILGKARRHSSDSRWGPTGLRRPINVQERERWTNSPGILRKIVWRRSWRLLGLFLGVDFVVAFGLATARPASLREFDPLGRQEAR